MDIQRIGMIGSRKLSSGQVFQYRNLAFELAKAGYTIVSGGCSRGGDKAATDGVNDFNQGQSLTLYLDAGHHMSGQFPPRSTHHWISEKLDLGVVALAHRHADAHQWQPAYRGYFIRNAAIAMNSDLLIAWRNGDSRGTNHTLMCGKELGVPNFLVDRVYGTAPWTTGEELAERVLAAIERMKGR